MKVILIQPQHNYARLAPPLSLGYLASYARKHIDDVELRILDLCMDENPESAIDSFDPEIIGVTGSSPIAGTQSTLIANLRKRYPSKAIFVGGPHASALKEKMLDLDVDGIVVGEGEVTFIEIVRQKGRADGIPGVITKNGRFTPREPMRDMDNIPFPDRSDFQLSRYSIPGGMVTSRGCPFNCTFCSQHVFGKTWRPHSPEYVVEEMEYLVKRFGVSFIRVMEDNPLLNKQRIIRICDLMRQRGLLGKIRVENNGGIRANHIDEDILEILKLMKMDVIWIGLESADPEVLRFMKKGVTVEQVENAVCMAKKRGFLVSLYIIIGMPGDTLEKNRQTLEFVRKLGVDNCLTSIATPYPGSELLDWVNENGRWIEKDFRKWYGHIDVDIAPPFDTEDFTLRERIEAYQMWARYVGRLRAGILLKRPLRALAYAYRNPGVVSGIVKRMFYKRV